MIAYAMQERSVSENPDVGPQGAGWKQEEAFTLEARHHSQIVAAPLSHGSNPNSNAAGRRREDDENLVAFHPTGGGAKGLSALSDVTTPGTGTGAMGTVAIAGTVRSHTRPGSNTDATVVQEASVRRLMPVECERLQSLPDDWTQLGDTADSPRYAALGDAVTSSVAEWIGRRIISA